MSGAPNGAAMLCWDGADEVTGWPSANRLGQFVS